MIETLITTGFERVMGSGRTQPCLMICEDAQGDEHEIVVKLKGHPQICPGGLLAEAMASLTGNELDLNLPTPYKIEIESNFADTVTDSALRDILRNSLGENFGTSKWEAGTTIWPKDKPLKKSIRQSAAEIFAFDAILQNPDRRTTNPNCAHLGNELLIFDHESAFTQFMSISPQNPWDNECLSFLKDHIFYNSLRGGNLKLDRLEGAILALDASMLDGFAASLPSDWAGTTLTPDKITSYLLECRDHFSDIRLQLEAIL